MARWTNRWNLARRSLAEAALVIGLGLVGCDKHDNAEAPGNGDASQQTAAEPGKNSTSTAQEGKGATGPVSFGGGDRLHQPFAKAARQFDNPPPQSSVPPDITISGKYVFKILEQVKNTWESIHFATPDGKRIEYSALIETEQGTIEITLLPEVAPNHVRSFVALARAGFYDDLWFDRVQFQQAPATDRSPAVKLEQLEAGNPRGPEDINGTVGYWLHPEFNDKYMHEPGTVGACRDASPDSAGCRFYVTLSKDPLLDGNYTIFGKVKTGLDAARRIYEKPLVIEDQGREGLLRPLMPVVIKKVTIQTRVAEGAK